MKENNGFFIWLIVLSLVWGISSIFKKMETSSTDHNYEEVYRSTERPYEETYHSTERSHEDYTDTSSEQKCHPSYSGCLNPNVSDYDCAGGSGNGPYYTGMVRVIGPDVFGLDRDGDGWGCE